MHMDHHGYIFSCWHGLPLRTAVACIVAQVAKRAGSLADITGMIASHGINVQSLAVGSSEQPGRSRITVVVPRDDAGLASLKKKVRPV
jgi:acetolactate synthase I/III small subunit